MALAFLGLVARSWASGSWSTGTEAAALGEGDQRPPESSGLLDCSAHIKKGAEMAGAWRRVAADKAIREMNEAILILGTPVLPQEELAFLSDDTTRPLLEFGVQQSLSSSS